MTIAWIVGVLLLGGSLATRAARWSFVLALAGVLLLTANLVFAWEFL